MSSDDMPAMSPVPRPGVFETAPKGVRSAARPGTGRIASGALLLLLGLGPQAAPAPDEQPAPIRVIIHADSKAQTLPCRDVQRIFLGQLTRWDDDTPIRPVDQSMRSPARRAFSVWVLERTIGEVTRYWNQHDERRPPTVLASDAAVVEYVARHPGAIGYVSREAKLEGVRAVRLSD